MASFTRWEIANSERRSPPLENAVRYSVSEGALLMTEQLALQKIQRNGRAIKLYKWASEALACVVNGMCDELLACTGFPLDEDSRVGVGHLLHLVENRFQSGAIADDPIESTFGLVVLRPKVDCRNQVNSPRKLHVVPIKEAVVRTQEYGAGR